jgi:tetratricopeptide (TPR) repeat protein
LTGYDQAERLRRPDTNPIEEEPIASSAMQNWMRLAGLRSGVPADLSPGSQETSTDPGAGHRRRYQPGGSAGAGQNRGRTEPEDPYAWFSLGSNLVYFDRYGEAAQAFDTALGLGLPWRFTRYQFGPYIAYFNQARFQDLIDLADATLYRTYKSEESLLWRGWGKYRTGDPFGAIEDFREALQYNPNYLDAQYALEFVGATR